MFLPLILILISLILMLISIALDLKIKLKNFNISIYWIIALICCLTCIIFNFINIDGLNNIFFSSSNINPLKILIIFLSCTGLSVLLDEIGLFNYLANIALKKSSSSQKKIFFTFNFIIAFLTIFTSNDILILTFTPFICHFTKRAKIDPTPFIISEFVTANVWSMFFFIDNPTNIYLCSIFGISFIDYTLNMFIPTILGGITSIIILYFLFRKKLNKQINISIEEIAKPNKALLIIGLIGLFSTIFLMSIASYINIQLWYIPLFFLVITYTFEFIFEKIQKLNNNLILNSIKKLPFQIIPFLLSMSIIIETLNQIGFINILANFLDGKSSIFIGILAFLSGNIVNNIPMSMFFASILSNFSASLASIYSVVIASNVCAFLTPIGALAGIMFMNILKNNDIKLSFKKFVLYGIIVSVPTILVCLCSLFII